MVISEPLVSIFCDTYNHELYIKQCLEGFISQKTNFAFEVLVHDDASTDRTPEIIREYEKLYPHIIKPVYQSVNHYSRGMKIWINYQFPRVKGKYIALCEGDDYWTDPYKLQKQVQFLEENRDCSACYTNAIYLDENNKSSDVYLKGLKEGRVPINSLILRGGAIYPTASLVFRYTPYIFDGFKKIYELNGDNLLILLLAMQGCVYYFDQTSCVYRKWDGGVYSKTINDKSAAINRKVKTVIGLKKLLKISKKPFKRYIIKRISGESLYVLLNDKSVERMAYLKNLNMKDLLRFLRKVILDS